MAKNKVKKKRAKHYEKPLKLYASFEDSVKALVAEPMQTYRKKKS